MKFRSIFLLLLMLFVSMVPACSPAASGTKVVSPTALQQASATRDLPAVVPTVIAAPNPEVSALVFLQSWQVEDYQAMYNMLTPASQDALPLEKFIDRYKVAANNMMLQKLDVSILSKMTNPSSAQVAYRVVFHTKMLGDMTRDITMNLSLEKGDWRVQWDDGLIMPELHGGNVLISEMKAPTRGNIYDRNGNAIAAANDIFWLGFRKGDTNPDQEGTLLNELSKLTGKTPEAIRAMYNFDYIPVGTYIAVGYATRDQVMERYDVLSSLTGLQMGEYKGRYYSDGGIAPQVTGYVQAIPAEEEDTYLRNGYRMDDRVGMAGVEKWGEPYLLGQRGASLYVNSPEGSTVTRLAQVESKPSDSIYLTLDSNLQVEAQKAIASFTGAIVVIERDTGRVLAMVSSPGFNPNAFESIGNNNSYTMLSNLTGGSNQDPLYNRAAGHGYPLGSVFKIITMAAALESGVFKPEDTYDCQYEFKDLNSGEVLYDWTYEKGYDPSGMLNLPEGLMRSCNPWFYHIGVELFRQGHEKDISDMARAFGLGSATGIKGLDFDETGNIPDPTDESSAARIAIGQAQVLVNPLQVARFVAAVGNGGTLYTPQVIEKITDPDGKASFEFKPEAKSKLPVKPENLKIIQDAMRRVIADPRGTAVRAFSGLSLPVFGKTGTAQNDTPGHPHAWFAGYTNTGGGGKPDIAFAVIAENAGEGSDIAAPIARRLLEVYFMGKAQKIYPWESRINLTRTPTPVETETPQP